MPLGGFDVAALKPLRLPVCLWLTNWFNQECIGLSEDDAFC